MSGFTLVELVLVLVLVGILGAVTLPRLQLGSQFEQRLQAENLVGLLRLAQLRAMNDPEALDSTSDTARCGRVAITKNGYSLSKNCSTAQLLDDSLLKAMEQQGLFLGKKGLTITLISSSYSLPLVVQFGLPTTEAKYLSEHSRLGRPHIISKDGVITRLTDELDIVVGDKTVRIEPEGYIHAP